MDKQRAFLKWAGGKYRLIDQILARLPNKACLVEPFVGAGSVFLNSDFEHYLLADINPDLINLYQVIQQDVDGYIQSARQLFTHPDANTASFYYAQRKRFNLSKNLQERAVLFLYLNRFGFNGLCRYNKKHEYNVPFGDYRQHYFPEQELRFFAEKAQRATFLCIGFEQLFEQLFAEQRASPMQYVVYCDPPYAPLEQESNFTQYAGGGFSLNQQQRLADYARQAVQCQIPVLISNHDTPFTRQIYHGAKIESLQVQRSIGKNAGSRVKVPELFALFG